VKNYGDLANTLGMAFSNYANRVQNGDVAPYKDFLAGADSVYIRVMLKPNGSIVVADGSEVEVIKAENRHLEDKVKDQEKEIKSLNLMLAQMLKEKEKSEDLTPEEIADIEESEKEFQEGKTEVFDNADELIADLHKEKQTKKKRRAKRK